MCDEESGEELEFEDEEIITVPYRKGILKRSSVIIMLACTVILLISIVGVIGELIYINSSDDSSSPDFSVTPLSSGDYIKFDDDTEQEFYLFFQISDIHLEPSYDGSISVKNYCSNKNKFVEKDDNKKRVYQYGKYGCDPPEILLNKTLEGMKEVNPNPYFILLTGDLVGHDQSSSTKQLEVIVRVSNIIQEYFPKTSVFPAIGNNDLYPDYYFSSEQPSIFTTDLANLWGIWLDEDQINSFLKGGYYSVDIFSGNSKLIVLNTVLYSTERLGGDDSDDPCGQFSFLETELQDAENNNQFVILQYHIPAGVNSYDRTEPWKSKYVTSFNKILNNHKSTIKIQLGAHYHTDDYRLFPSTKDIDIDSRLSSSAVLLNPSVSPVHYNNPSFRMYNATNEKILNYVQYYADLLQSNIKESLSFEIEYSLNDAYSVKEISLETISTIVDEITYSNRLYNEYYSHKYVFYNRDRVPLLCAISTLHTDEYNECIYYYDDDHDGH
eukprot:TRINITY_DN1044_c1_g2_i1.p1 TRINITY_DN1044_c1_g2~~TRINITY_DN1044_c1_g2_i1.p1  ORF type:complete len:497 (+),score=90.22 TRINITY_DN1044_c1_g2_i1:64-1554(+)